MDAAQRLTPACPDLLSLKGLRAGTLPPGFAHDFMQTRIGWGSDAFAAARRAFAQWMQFDLGWVRIANPAATIATGQIVAVEAHTAGLWSVNLSRIVDTVETGTRFGFLYATTRHHVEEGQERFLLEFDPVTEAVLYSIEAVSRPRHPLARLGWPFTRAMQHRFARDSHARMLRAVEAAASGVFRS